MATKKNLCAVLHASKDLRVEERPIPTPAEGEVLVGMRYVGVCGSDCTMYRTAKKGIYDLERPILVGHEPCGVVEGLGPGVTELAVGDRVAVQPLHGCGTCSLCLQGRYNICPKVSMLATPPTDGCLANYIAWPAYLCFKLPPQMTLEEAAVVQPVSLALYACKRVGLKAGDRVLISGAGPLGMVMVLVAKASGATAICVTEICKERLDFLTGVTGCYGVLADEGTPRDVADRVTSTLGGDADVALECSGAPAAVSYAIHAIKRGGCLLMAGIQPPETTAPLLNALSKEVDIRGMIRFTNTFQAAIDLMASGKVDVKPLIKYTYSIADSEEGFKTMGRKAPGKVIIKCFED